jgi:hypothetical protein
MTERRKLPSAFKKKEKNRKKAQTHLELFETFKAEAQIASNAIKMENKTHTLIMESVRIDFPLKPCKQI